MRFETELKLFYHLYRQIMARQVKTFGELVEHMEGHVCDFPPEKVLLHSFQLLKELHWGFFREVTREMFLTGEVPRRTPFEKGDPRLFAEKEGELIPDPFGDDQSLVIDTPQGLVVLLGCAHSGLINILSHVTGKLGRDGIYAILGGTHLDFASASQVEDTLSVLKNFQVERIGVSHCTGLKASSRLLAEFGEKFFFGMVGESLEF